MRLSSIALLCICLVTSPAFALDYTESADGDFSNDRTTPTFWGALPVGSSLLTGTTNSSDLDYFTINIPSGENLSGLKMVSFDGGDGGDETAFIGVQIGTTMTVPPDAQTAAGLLGWSHFGPGVGDVGQDILPFIGSQGFGSTGFVPPLLSNNYTFWIQQLGFDPTAYQFEFIVSAAGTTGDYNGNGTVDAADYDLFRKYENTTHALPNDPTGGIIGTAQYNQWRTNFGKPAGSGANVGTVPEPASLLLLVAGTLATWFPSRETIANREFE
jgi:hypothetical protein